MLNERRAPSPGDPNTAPHLRTWPEGATLAPFSAPCPCPDPPLTHLPWGHLHIASFHSPSERCFISLFPCASPSEVSFRVPEETARMGKAAGSGGVRVAVGLSAVGSVAAVVVCTVFAFRVVADVQDLRAGLDRDMLQFRVSSVKAVGGRGGSVGTVRGPGVVEGAVVGDGVAGEGGAGGAAAGGPGRRRLLPHPAHPPAHHQGQRGENQW